MNTEKNITNETPISFLTVGEFKKIIHECIEFINPLENTVNIPDTFGKEECSKLTGYSVNTINKMICEKTIPYYKPGHKVVFKKDEIMKWLLRNRVETVEEYLSNNT